MEVKYNVKCSFKNCEKVNVRLNIKAKINKLKHKSDSYSIAFINIY